MKQQTIDPSPAPRGMTMKELRAARDTGRPVEFEAYNGHGHITARVRIVNKHGYVTIAYPAPGTFREAVSTMQAAEACRRLSFR